MYGSRINLTYKNEDTYKTLPGGIATIISRLAIVIFLLFQIKDLIGRKNDVRIKTVYKDLTVDSTEYYLNMSNFDIAVTVNYYGENAT